MNVFKEMGCAVGKVSAYPKFLKNKKGKVFGYSVLLLFFYFILDRKSTRLNSSHMA